MFYERGEGSRIWDVDGNEFVDYVLARGPLLLGHSPRKVLDAVIQQMEQGLMFAGQHRLEIELVASVFEQHPGQIAAVLTEPIMCNTGCIMPEQGYLEGLRELCTRHGALLVFDEVITGFRASLGGAQQYFDVAPDLATFAKGIAGGFPVSAIVGREEVMRAFGDLSVTHSGTYNSNGPSMAATLAAMEMLDEDGGAILKHAHAIGKQLMQGIEAAGRRAGKNVEVRGIGPIFNVSFGSSPAGDGGPVTDYRSYVSRDRAADAEAYRRFNLALQERGIRTVPSGQWFVSTAHTQEDVDKTLAAVTEAMEEV